MLHYDRIDFFEAVDVNEASESKGCDVYHYWYFLNKGFKFQPYVYNSCHDLLMISMTFSNIAILNIEILIIAALLAELAKVRQ